MLRSALRHWVCSTCSYDHMQEHDNDLCPLCREAVIEYVEVGAN